MVRIRHRFVVPPGLSCTHSLLDARDERRPHLPVANGHVLHLFAARRAFALVPATELRDERNDDEKPSAQHHPDIDDEFDEKGALKRRRGPSES